MKRRLYYLLPDVKHADLFFNDLRKDQISHQDIHAVVNTGTQLENKFDIHDRTEPDRDYYIEWLLWRLNLVVFFIALASFVFMLFSTISYWMVLPLTIMMLTFSAGYYFATKIPKVHLNAFNSELNRGEILMMVDVPAKKIWKLMRHMQQKHPEAITGGVCWHI